MFACPCLNVSIAVNDESTIPSSTTTTDPGRVTLKNGIISVRPPAAVIAGLAEGKSRELASFFQESIGPLQEANVTIQLAMMLKTIPCDGWNVCKCQNCGAVAFARDSSNSATILINGTLAITTDEVNRRKGQENYSPAFRIVLDGRAADFRGFYRKDQYRNLFTAAANTLDSTNDRNELLVSLRAFMLAETQSANERIARVTQEQNEQLSHVRDRAEQDYLFLAQTFVPELLASKSGEQQGAGTATSPSTEKALQPLLTNLGTPGPAADVADSHLETPPATPECMPMSTGNSPPSIVNGNGASVSPDQNAGTVPTDADTDGFKPAAGNQRPPIQLSNSAANTINNNTTNSNQGAISKPPTQQQQQHSMSTNLFANHGSTLGAATTVPGLAGSVGNLTGATHRFSSNVHQRPQQQQTMFDSDCMFDIDGMENDKTPPPDDISDEEHSDYDDIPDNNNRADGGIFIPRHQYGRQTSSIAKSLPISMPKKMAPFRANEDDLDEMVEDTVDIAASIKALAKSVHGEAVFGDLPRRQIQKFTSHI
ncbi:uncharacterized protein LOC128708400 [Anopheles marshallii]|uniref:uncharacterized protein LOC128708400 n=1 Tax=Anopheles marshallii TaxID=1521116 RepID=UPI00237B367A|nr:uncharacterized protein LOC128708400 [Anopheles marshallii]